MYTTIKAYCIDRTLHISSIPPITSGGENDTCIEVSFDAAWDGYAKTATFYRKKNKVFHVVMTNDACVIPREVMAEPGTLYFSIIGTTTGSTRTATEVALTVEQGAVTGLNPFEPLPDVYKQVLDIEQKNEARLNNLLAGGTTDGELKDLRVGARGKTYPAAGEAIREQFLSISIPAAAIEPSHDLDLNHYTSPANYVFALTSGVINAPDHFIEGADVPRYLVVECFGERNDSLGGIQTWGRQTIYTVDGDKAYCRYFKYDYVSSSFVFNMWRSVNEYNNHRTITSGLDLNGIVEPDNYIVATTEAQNAPFNWAGFLLKVETTSNGWLVQHIHGLHNNPCHYYRVGNNSSGVYTNGATVNWSEWQRALDERDLPVKQNSGQVIVNMGDSIVGNTQDSTSISAVLAKETGATTHNFGFGGCRMSTHDGDPWNAFSMHALADAIASGDFTKQEVAANHADVPAYFTTTVANMKALDFSTVDILTIAYGVNDYTAGRSLDNSNDRLVVDCYGSALRYAIEKILSAYPNIRPVIVTPAWCFWPAADGSVEQDSDTRYFNAEQNTLRDYAQKCIEVAEEYHIPVVRAYHELAINKFNCSRWFNAGDGIHPNSDGRKAIAKLISKTLAGM